MKFQANVYAFYFSIMVFIGTASGFGSTHDDKDSSLHFQIKPATFIHNDYENDNDKENSYLKYSVVQNGLNVIYSFAKTYVENIEDYQFSFLFYYINTVPKQIKHLNFTKHEIVCGENKLYLFYYSYKDDDKKLFNTIINDTWRFNDAKDDAYEYNLNGLLNNEQYREAAELLYHYVHIHYCTNVDLKKYDIQNLSALHVASIIKNQKCLFITESEISSPTIPTTDEFWHANGFAFSKKSIFSYLNFTKKELETFLKDEQVIHYENFPALESLINNPEWLYNNGCKQAEKIFGTQQPTLAHRALNDILSLKNAPLLTITNDHLHQATGIIPVRLSSVDNSEMTLDEWRSFDAIVHIGQRESANNNEDYDDLRFFMGMYQNYNSHGLLVLLNNQLVEDNCYPISVNFNKLRGNVQQTLPQIRDELMKLHNVQTSSIHHDLN